MLKLQRYKLVFARLVTSTVPSALLLVRRQPYIENYRFHCNPPQMCKLPYCWIFWSFHVRGVGRRLNTHRVVIRFAIVGQNRQSNWQPGNSRPFIVRREQDYGLAVNKVTSKVG